MALTTKEKSTLKKLANPLSASLTVGKNEVTDTLIAAVKNALLAHELIKVKVLCETQKEAVACGHDIASLTGSELVHVIGHTLILFKRNPEHPKIQF